MLFILSVAVLVLVLALSQGPTMQSIELVYPFQVFRSG